MKHNDRKKALFLVHWMAGLCAVAGMVASIRGLYGLFQVWAGELTNVPLIGELTYPRDAEPGFGFLFSLFEVGFGGLAYAFFWTTPAAIALGALTMIAHHLEKPSRDRLEAVQ